MIDRQQFQRFIDQGYNRIPVVHELIADLETPIGVYLKLANSPYTYLFESVVGGERWGRYSFIGLPAKEIIRVLDGVISVEKDGVITQETEVNDPLAWIEQYQQQFNVPKIEALPLFNGGLVGYFGYDTIRYIEPKLVKCPLPNTLGVPDILLMVSDRLVVFDNLRAKAYLVLYVDPKQVDYPLALAELAAIYQQLQKTIALPTHNQEEPTSAFVSNMTKADYEGAVKKAQQYFVEGDAMQLILSQRLVTAFNDPPINFYRALRSINPSPYLYYLNLKDFYIAGSSPEILVRVEQGEVTVRPLAGTRPRGKSPAEDLNLAQDLLTDPKELAEHLMLIDLGRNDVGRVSEYGSVKVTEKMGIERYSHVMHIVSNVVGRLKPNLSALDVLRATFPAGTVSGTPKIRAMEIIDELEQEKRGIYAGAIGYLAWNGSMDVAIALRTGVIKEKKLYVQAGAGLVVDSVPQAEWQETMNKARALLQAAEMARRY